MICEKCRNVIADTAKFCPKCGQVVKPAAADHGIAMKKCPQCGADNLLSARFCKIDGYNFLQKKEGGMAMPPAGKVYCPKCGTSYNLGVRFCRNDGTSLQQDITDASMSPSLKRKSTKHLTRDSHDKKTVPSEANRAGGGKKKFIFVTASILLLLLVAGAGYLFWSVYLGVNPDKIAAKINDELSEKGFSVYCEIDKDWKAILKGSVPSERDKDTAMSIVKAFKEIKDLKLDVQVTLTPSEVKVAIDNALRDGGIQDVHAVVNDNLIATIQGTTGSESEKESAMRIAVGIGKAKEVKNDIQVQAPLPQPQASAVTPPLTKLPRKDQKQKYRGQDEPRVVQTPTPELAKVEETPRIVETPTINPGNTENLINRRLQNAGLKGITAEVDNDLNVTLKGITESADDKRKALYIASSVIKINGAVRDKIFVVR